MSYRALGFLLIAALLSALSLSFTTSRTLAASHMVWSFSEGNDPDNRGRMTARLSYGVPETDNVQVDGVCEARQGTSVRSANLILGADVGKLADGANVNVRFTGGGFNHFVSGSVYGTKLEEGITGVSLDVSVDDRLWKALSENDSLDYLVPGYSASKLSLKEGRGKIRQFIRACRAYAEALDSDKTAQTSPAPKRTAQYQTAAGPEKTAAQTGGVSEKEAYEAAKELGTIEAWEAFLNNFSNGFRAELARAYVKRLGAAGPAKSASPPPAPKVTAAPPPPPPPPPGPADISITQTANQGACKGGDSCSYTMVATNTGGTAFTGQLVIANSLVPRGATLTSRGNAPWFCQGMGGGAVCTNPNANIAPGGSATLSLTFKLPRRAGSSVTSCASISWGGAPTGSSVRDVQQALNAQGFNVGRPDGKAGRKTLKAIREFQGLNGLQPTGEIDLPLLIALFTVPGAGDANPANDQACAGSAVTPAPVTFTPAPALPTWQPPRGTKAITRKGPPGKCSSRSVWLEGKCILKSAVASYCGPGFHREGSNCVSNANRATTAPVTGKCSSRSVWLEGQCIAKSQVMSFCGPGYHREGSKCVSNANRAATAPAGGKNTQKPKSRLSAAQINAQIYSDCVAAGIGVGVTGIGVGVTGGCRGMAARGTKWVLSTNDHAAGLAYIKRDIRATSAALKTQKGGGQTKKKPKSPPVKKTKVNQRICAPGEAGKCTCPAGKAKSLGRPESLATCQPLCAAGLVRMNGICCPPGSLPNKDNICIKYGKDNKVIGPAKMPSQVKQQTQQKPQVQQKSCISNQVRYANGNCGCPSNKPRWSKGKCKKAKGVNQFLKQLQQPQNQPQTQPQNPQTQQQPPQNQGQQQLQNLLNQFSDARLKRDVTHLATLKSGIRLYAFRYVWEDGFRVGVMAQELLRDPAWRDAVSLHPSGYYQVEYGALGLRMTTLADWQAHGLSSVMAGPVAARAKSRAVAIAD